MIVDKKIKKLRLWGLDEVIREIAGTTPSGSGLSAYQIAVNRGFIGTEDEWLLSLKGPQGNNGAEGPQGTPGPRGDQGIQGPAGPKGDRGDTGAQGPVGIKGDTGDTGPQGPAGTNGETGAQGPQGLQGVQGPAGDAGPQGVAGPSNFIIQVQALTSSPTDGATVYFGMLPKAPTTTANTSKVYLRRSCTLKHAEIYCYSGTAGTNETWSLYVRKNNTTDTLISTLNVNTSERVFTNASLNVSFVAGDYFEIKGIQPTWATNPATTIYGGYLYFE